MSTAEATPIDMVLHCPNCGEQHIDAPDKPIHPIIGKAWNNPPHRSHLCHYCGHTWRPADVCTNGVAAIKTKGKNDSPAPTASLVPWHEVFDLLGRLSCNDLDRDGAWQAYEALMSRAPKESKHEPR